MLKNIFLGIGLFFIALWAFCINAEAQTVKLYPSTLRITKGKSNTATAIYKNSSGVHSNAIFSFSSSSPSVASATNDITVSGTSGNLASIKGLNAGTTTITASYNGLTTNSLTVVVDDPAATPLAEIHGDNDASGGGTITTRIGEAIEVNGELSQGVSSIEWDWGDGDKTLDILSSTHSYLLPGSYTLNLKITNAGGSVSTDTVTVIVQDFPAPTNTFIVTTRQELLTAYNQCNGGEHIVIPAGTTIVGKIELPNRNLSDYVTIRSSGTMPDIRNRISPGSNQLASIKSDGYNEPALKIKNSASKLRFIGINFQTYEQPNFDQFSIIEVGEFSQTSLATNPQKIIFQHIVINPPDSTMVRHGIMNDGYKISVISSWLGNIFTRCVPGQGCVTDSNAAYSLNGKGAHVYYNSYIEASSENIIYGGDTVSVDGHTPTNVEIRRCYFYKRTSWKPNPTPLFNVKNLIEFKIGRRIYIEGNIFENHWLGADAGQPNAININSLAEPFSQWTVNEDIIFDNNKVIEMPSGVLLASSFYPASGNGSLVYHPRKSHNIKFRNMLFDKFNGAGPKRLIILNGAEDALFDRVTQIDTGSTASRLMDISTKSNYRFQLTNSIVGMGTDYQIFADGGYFGRCALNFGTDGTNTTAPCNPNGNWTVGNNIFVRYNSDALINPPSNNCDSAIGFSAVGFIDLTNCDYRLSGSGACYPNQTNIGADIPLLNLKTSCTISGIGTNCSGTPPTQSPYPGPGAPSITTTIEAENFDKGGNFASGGFAYNDIFGTTGSGSYRSNPVEAVDISANSNADNGFIVNEAAANEWLEYTVNVPSAGLYNFAVRYSSGYGQAFSQGKFRLEVCEPTTGGGVANCVVSTDVTVNSTGGWSNFNVVKAPLYLPASGTRILRLVMVANAPGDTNCSCVVANFDSIKASNQRTLFDYDNDRKADISLFRPSDATWYLQQSTSGFGAIQFGFSNDTIAPADFDGDGKTDIAIYRPGTGVWWILRSSNLTVYAFQFGNSTDIPVQGDYTGDGKADGAVWRPSTGEWFVLRSEDSSFYSIPFGQSGDRPTAGDFDGDGKFDPAVFRPSNTIWYRQQSVAGFAATQLGLSTDKVTPADFDGDGKTDLAVWRPSDGNWYRFNSSNGQFVTFQLGASGDLPAPADYDGDGKVDYGIFRPGNGTWYLQQTTNGAATLNFGLNNDIPTPSTYVR